MKERLLSIASAERGKGVALVCAAALAISPGRRLLLGRQEPRQLNGILDRENYALRRGSMWRPCTAGGFIVDLGIRQGRRARPPAWDDRQPL